MEGQQVVKEQQAKIEREEILNVPQGCFVKVTNRWLCEHFDHGRCEQLFCVVWFVQRWRLFLCAR